MEILIKDEAVAFATFKELLKLYIDDNFAACSGFLNDIVKAEDEKSLKKLFIKHSDDIFEKLGGDPDSEDRISDLEKDISELNDEINTLEGKIEEYDELTGNTINDNFKMEHFINYRDDYNEWELEDLLKNGRKYLSI